MESGIQLQLQISRCLHPHLGGFMIVFKLPLRSVGTLSILSSNLQSYIWLTLHSMPWSCFQSQEGKWYFWREIYPADFETRWTVLPYRPFISPLTTEATEKNHLRLDLRIVVKIKVSCNRRAFANVCGRL